MFVLPEASRSYRYYSSFLVLEPNDLAQHTLVHRDNPRSVTTTAETRKTYGVYSRGTTSKKETISIHVVH